MGNWPRAAQRLAGIAVIMLVAACGGGSSSSSSGNLPAKWKITVLTPTTGKYAANAITYNAGLQIAADEINQAGGIEGRPVQIDLQDTQGDIAQGIALARQDCQDGVPLLIGPLLSTEAQSVFPVVNGASCPTLAPSPAASGLTEKNRPWTFRLATPLNVIAPIGVKAFADAVHPTSAVIVTDTSDPASSEQATISKDALAQAGAKVLDTLTISASTVDFASVVTRIANAKPQAIVLSVTAAAASISFIREVHKQNLGSIPMLFTAATYNTQISQLPQDQTNGAYLYTQFWPGNPNPATKALVDAYAKIRPNEPPSQLAPQAHDSLLITKAAYEKCKVSGDSGKVKTERNCIKDYLTNLTNFKGAYGTFSMSKDGYTVTPVYLLKYGSGQLSLIKTGTP